MKTSSIVAMIATAVFLGGHAFGAQSSDPSRTSGQDLPKEGGPKLLDAWPKEGPPLVWKSGFIPSYRDGGCAGVVVADGKVFVYCNKQYAGGDDGYKIITAETLEFLKSKGLSAEELAIAAKQKDVAHNTLADWVAALRGVTGIKIGHHIYVSPLLQELWEKAFVWSDTVYCLDEATGKELWKKSFPVDKATLKSPVFGGHPVQWWVFEGLGASGTPTAWGGKVYVVGSAGLYCLSAKDGSLVWQVKSGPEHGFPLVADGIVYHLGVAYDAETGAVRWKNPLWVLSDVKHSRYEWIARYGGGSLWTSGGPSSPGGYAGAGKKYVKTSDGRDQGSLSCVCLEWETGKVMWSFKGPKSAGWYSIQDDLLLADGGENVPLCHAFKVSPAGVEKEPLWKGRFGVPRLTSGDYAYGGNGVLYCVSLKTGEMMWKTTKYVCCAQVVADGKIFGSVDSGGYTETVPVGMIRATPDKYEPLGSFYPEAITLGGVSLVNGKLFVRTKDRIACYDVQEHGVYQEGVTVAQNTLTFRFKQTGGGLNGDVSKLLITAGGGAQSPAKARVDGDSIVVDIQGTPLLFGISCATGVFTGKNGKPVPAFGWSEARQLKFNKAYDSTIVLNSSDKPLQKGGAWKQPATYSVAGAKVTSAEVDPTGRSVYLTTDKTWTMGGAVKVTYPCFQVDRGEPRRETVSATVSEIQCAAAKFVKVDEATSGDWKGKYGSEGAMVAGDRNTAQAPKCASVEMRNCVLNKRWAVKNTNPVQLLFTGDNKGRTIEDWHSGDELFIDVDIKDGKEHQVAIYVGSRNPGSIEVLDADTKKVLDTHDIPKGFNYLAWNIKGSVTLHVVNLGSAEAAGVDVGGVFFDPAGE